MIRCGWSLGHTLNSEGMKSTQWWSQEKPGFKSYFYVVVMQPWAIYFTFLILSFLTYKIDMIMPHWAVVEIFFLKNTN